MTQRILASILPRREPSAATGAAATDDDVNDNDDDDDDVQSIGPHNETRLQDKYEKEVISMLEQKHGKVMYAFYSEYDGVIIGGFVFYK